MNNSFRYQTSFQKIIEVQVFHDYFLDKKARGIKVKPVPETLRDIKNYNMLFKPLDNGFVLLVNKDSNNISQVFSGAIKLEFTFSFTDNLFLNYTDIPFTNNQELKLNNERGLMRLHSNSYISPDDFVVSNNDQLTAQLSLIINKENEFFGHEQLNKSYQCDKYSVNFNSRKVIPRYNFYSSRRDEDYKGYFVTDDSSEKKWFNFKNRTLENGLSVKALEMESELKLIEKFNSKFFLKRQDEFNQSYSKFLPHPDPKNISFDENLSKYYCDVFVKID